ncbi:MAG TPA: tetratricopeptide repeat protein [Myxococcota bacterium]|nr:tetratricopeptide repeat protein [Myxococcota bacterium]HQK52055.1 tetratricopeptide repeat protein [Myxococcota bacterium]
MGNPIFIRTSEGVLLRFEDASVARRWIESGRIQWSDRFLGTDQAWHPLTDLLDFSQAGRAGPATPPSFPAGGVPDRGAARVPAEAPPEGPEDLRRTGEWVPPVLDPGPRAPEPVAAPTERISTAPLPSREDQAVQTASIPDSGPAFPGDGPTRSQGETAPAPAEAVEGEWWASDPGGSRSLPLQRVLLVVIPVLVTAGALALWWAGRLGREEGVASPDRPDAVLVGGAGDPGATDPVLAGGPAAEGPDAPVGGQDRGIPPAEDPGVSSGDAAPPGGEATREVAPEVAPGTRPASRSEPREGRQVDPSPPEEPDTYDAHMEAGNRLMTTRPDAAMAHFRRAAQLRPTRVEPLSRMGDLAMQQQDLEGAERHYREALRRNADYGPTMLGIARLRHRKGNREDARYWFTRYLERFPQGGGAAEARAYLEAP